MPQRNRSRPQGRLSASFDKFYQELLPELGYLGRNHHLAVSLVGILFKVPLVIRFGFVEAGVRNNLRDNPRRPYMRGIQLTDLCFSSIFLFWGWL